ncbi:unnamed protein product [Rangifer tarandus platyrhynchus]|uniref:Uncharacterized protein n=1 Tax=Rangifer tarandus platyrhynchus TaxID=3082113 RepID=A0AC59Z4J7_RANTA
MSDFTQHAGRTLDGAVSAGVPALWPRKVTLPPAPLTSLPKAEGRISSPADTALPPSVEDSGISFIPRCSAASQTRLNVLALETGLPLKAIAG